jgi:hypothetical protein
MLALVTANLVVVVLFGVLYAVTAARYLPQAGFLICLPVLFALATTMWVRTEARHGGREPLARIGRIAAGLVIALIGVPVAVLVPLFWLDSMLPPEAGLARVLPGTMTLVLIVLAITVLVNLAGALVAAARGALTSRPRREV